MDLIYTDSSRNDIGVLLDYDLDLAFGDEENDFECRVCKESHCCTSGSLLYIEGTEYGGIVDAIESNTSTNEVVYSGRTWHGIVEGKVIEPDNGQAYLVVSGDANTVIGNLITRLNLSTLFEASQETSGITFTNYQFPRYISAYSGIRKALASKGAKLKMSFSNGKVILSAEQIHDYSSDDEFDGDLVPFSAKRIYKGINHLICLGAGELQNRLVVHLYADGNGNISRSRTYSGYNERTAIYEYSEITSEAEMVTEGTKEFKSLISTGEISIDLDSDEDRFDVGDIIGSYDNITGINVSEGITKKIVSISNGQVSVEYETEEHEGNSGSGGVYDEDAFLPLSGGVLTGSLEGTLITASDSLSTNGKTAYNSEHTGVYMSKYGAVTTRRSAGSFHRYLFYGDESKYTRIKPSSLADTDSVDLTLPNKSGTIAIEQGFIDITDQVVFDSTNPQSASYTSIYSDGKTVVINYASTSKAHSTGSTDGRLFVLPVGYRPRKTLWGNFATAYSKAGTYFIRTDGVCYIYGITSTTSTATITINNTFVI